MIDTRAVIVDEDAKLGPVVVLQEGGAVKLGDYLEYFDRQGHREVDGLKEDEQLVVEENGGYQYRRSLREQRFDYRS